MNKKSVYSENFLNFVKITDNPVEEFLKRFFTINLDSPTLIIVTPIIGSLFGTKYSIQKLKNKIDSERILTYIITRTPEEKFHNDAIDILKSSDFVEIRYNNSLHAKLYVCIGKNDGYAMLGSGNLTETSIRENIEIGILILNRGKGKKILNELFRWGIVRLRTLKESKLIKSIKYKGGNTT